MGYYTGSVNDMPALRQALIDACVLEGWSWNGSNEVLSKGVAYVKIQVVAGPYLTFLAGTGVDGAGVTGAAPNAVRIGRAGLTGYPFPATYEIFVFANEVFLVTNYAVDRYQWAAFGLSSVDGVPGSKMWISASIGISIRVDSDSVANIAADGSGAGGFNSGAGSLAMFWATGTLDGADYNSFVHHNLHGGGWDITGGLGYSGRIGASALAPIVGVLPSAWNSEAVLLPLRCYARRPSNKISLVAELENARITRVDNYAPGEIITIGSDRWMVFPWYRKNTAARNGGSVIDHTGTFGWAIRYEGP